MKFFKQVFISAIIAFFIFGFLIPKNVKAEDNFSGSSANLYEDSFVKPSDTRAKILKEYLNQHSSPLEENAKDFVRYADEFNLDWRLVAAISGVESTFGKFIPYDSYNAWGWGVYGNNVIYFSSWKEGIGTISKGLRENYINKMETDNIYRIGRLYAASPTWAVRVEYFMNKITEFQSNKASYSLSISL